MYKYPVSLSLSVYTASLHTDTHTAQYTKGA